MTLSGSNRRARGEQLKQERLERTARTSKRFPWLMPAIVVLAVVVVVTGVAIAIALGKFF
ncbi:hypothetical protein ACFPJ4_04015 [Lysinimonas soli]|uniref:Uncharacterized protein n=1 Tax=Lysinimonas soli TaxID=1074233 RepID=A0ABW0NLF7_9MICO